jgi:predicted nucleic acid-binding protein
MACSLKQITDAELRMSLLDLIHVAIALESGAENFLSFDNRQRLLARAAGLRTNP